jgi:hypothetical protein
MAVQASWNPWDPWTDVVPTSTLDQGTQSVNGQQAGYFAQLWDRWTNLWPSFLGLRQEILDRQARWQRLYDSALASDDAERLNIAVAALTALDSDESQRSAVESTVLKFRDTWYALRDYLVSAGRWIGMGGLGIPPLVLVLGIPAALAALAWVISTYTTVRGRLDADAQVLAAAERGAITTSQAAAILGQRGQSAPMFSADLSGWGPWLFLAGGLGAIYLWHRSQGGRP